MNNQCRNITYSSIYIIRNENMAMDMLDKPYVLIVDDIEDNALLLEFILGSDNYVIKCATSVAEAVEIMGDNTY